MIPNETAATPAAPVSSRRDRGLRANVFGVVLVILVQYGLGMWVNLFAKIPSSDQGKGPFAAFGAAVAHGPVALTLHALLGTLLLLGAIALLVRTALARKTAGTMTLLFLRGDGERSRA